MKEGVTRVDLVYNSITESASYAGLQTCGSVWMCPICAAKITERRKMEIEQAVKWAKGNDLKVVMMTYTFRHSFSDNLEDMLGKMSSAMYSYRSGRPYTSLREVYGIVGYIRCLEVTYGENGWHPHVHELVFISQSNIEGLEEKSRELWEQAAFKHGLSMNEHGFKMDCTDSRIAEYIAKFDKEPTDYTSCAILQVLRSGREVGMKLVS